jgi:hypothetical protein
LSDFLDDQSHTPVRPWRMKCCMKCGETKPLEDFYREKTGQDGYRLECKACNLAARKSWYERNAAREVARVKAWQRANPERVNEQRRAYREANRDKARAGHLQRKFGLTLAGYADLPAARRGGCAICGRTAPEGSSLHVDHDHDHDTGEVRGLLCFRGNGALGQLDEEPDRLNRAADHLDCGGFVTGGATELDSLVRARAAALVGRSLA